MPGAAFPSRGAARLGEKPPGGTFPASSTSGVDTRTNVARAWTVGTVVDAGGTGAGRLGRPGRAGRDAGCVAPRTAGELARAAEERRR